jgi:SP family general alpha glucoside:H+ symporter-like MFS transporter
MCWGIGSFLAAGILRGTLNLPGDAAWKVPYALQWIWPIPLFIIAWMAPESKSSERIYWARLTQIGPFYLVRKERIPEAREVVRKLARPGYRTERMIDAQIELLKQANEMEKINAANSSFRDCFRGVNTKRTIIGLMCWLIQQTNGETLTSYATLCKSLLHLNGPN